MDKELKRLKEIDKELYLLRGMLSLLFWDRSTYMPKKGIAVRAEKVSLLSRQSHELTTSRELKNIVSVLSKKQNYSKLSKLDKIIVDKYVKKIKKLSKLPSSHVEEFARVCMQAQQAWEEAREKNSFSHFRPYLEKMVALKLKEAKLIDPKAHPYNVFLDDFEEGTTLEEIRNVFQKLRTGLVEILNNIKRSEKYKAQKDELSKMDFPVEKQKVITSDIIKRMGIETDRNVISESIHPFSTHIGADDVRITTAYRNGQPLFSFTSTVHESGHALYELGFDEKLRNTVLLDAPSYGIHESQSRIWENQVCKGKEFWTFYYPFYSKQFKSLNNVSFERFYELMNRVRPSLIRIEGDEVTYCLHIIIRFEIEIALFENKVKVKDLPALWNKKYAEYLGVTPKNDNEGVLQDVHWSQGSFGYFPTYAFGTMYSAMLFKQMDNDVNGLRNHLSNGNLSVVLAWLRKNVHQYGCTMLTKDIIHKATGKYLSTDDFLAYLKEKYYDIYGIDD